MDSKNLYSQAKKKIDKVWNFHQMIFSKTNVTSLIIQKKNFNQLNLKLEEDHKWLNISLNN